MSLYSDQPRAFVPPQPDATEPAAASLDALLPRWDGRVAHEVTVAAPPELVYHVLEQVSMADMPAFTALAAIRSLGRARPDRTPMIAGMRDAAVVLTESVPNREITFALMGPFWTQSPFLPIPDRAAFLEPGRDDVARAAGVFRVEPAPGGTRLSTETRVRYPADPSTARTFARYWKLIGVIGASLWSRQMLGAARAKAHWLAGKPPAGLAWRAPLVSLGPALGLNLLLGAGAVVTLRSLARPRERQLPGPLRALAAAAASAPLIYALALRPRLNRLGTTDDELARHYPGDALAPEPAVETTRAITIEAPAAAVWPWLAQLGQDRGGLYSYDWLENLAGLDFHSANEIHPEWQDVRAGDRARLAAGQDTLIVAHVEPGRALVWRSPQPADFPPEHAPSSIPLGARIAWGFYLEPVGPDRCRLISRFRLQTTPPLAGKLFYWLTTEVPHFIMEQQMLRGIKARAERQSRSDDRTG